MTILGAIGGTLLTWALTALGSAMVYVIPDSNRSSEMNILNASLGFAAGVMLAASFWSLLDPAISLASEVCDYSETFAFVPAAIGFLLGALFVYACDHFVPDTQDFTFLIANKSKAERSISPAGEFARVVEAGNKTMRRRGTKNTAYEDRGQEDESNQLQEERRKMLRRMLLLVLAITVHNFPEGMAVGVAFGAVGTSKAATMSKAWNLAIGIGIQNFPEGLAVSMPLHRSGMSKWRSFWIGQLSGLVEPVAGICGACLVSTAQHLLPYALGFAAGAMVFVVVNDLIPEAQKSRNTALGSWGAILGFVTMMSLDVAFG